MNITALETLPFPKSERKQDLYGKCVEQSEIVDVGQDLKGKYGDRERN